MTDKTAKPTPNEQRSEIKNPTSPAHKEAQDNHSRQVNPQDPKHQPPPAPNPGKPKK